MTHPYANDLIEGIQNFAKIDVAETTALKFLGRLRIEMGDYFNEDVSEALIVSCVIELPDNSLDTAQINDLAEALTACFVNMQAALIMQGFKHPEKMLLGMGRNFSVKLA